MGEYKNMRLIIYIFGIALGIELEPSSDLDQTTCKCKENEECNNNMICVCKSDFIPVHGVGCMLKTNTEHTDTEQFREKNGVENILNYFLCFSVLPCLVISR